MENSQNQLNQSALALLSACTTEDTYKVVLSEAEKIAHADSGSIFLQQHNLLQRAYSNVAKHKQGIPSTTGLTQRAIKTGKPYIHKKRSLIATHPEMYKKGVKAIILIPLKYHEQTLGVMALQSYKPTKLHKHRLDALKTLALMASMTIKKTQQYSNLKEALETRDLLISVASHELKNPITTIHTYSELIKRTLDQKMLPGKKWIDMLSSEADRLNKLINELLNKNVLSATEIEYEWQKHRCSKILEEVIENFRTLQPQRAITLDYDIQDTQDHILVDKNKIQQVIINLLNNAAKFSPSHTPISLRLQVKPSYVVIQITDHGKGIAKKDMSQLFDKFYRGDHQIDGMGLGLFLAKNIIEKHHGKIAVKSQIDSGATFTITLPKCTHERINN